jgi:putative addiction module component (TIGR02574 family)
MTKEEILDEAQRLSRADREAIAEELMMGIVDDQEQTAIDAAWAAEAKRRADAVARGELRTIPGDQAMKEAFESLRQTRQK